MSFTRSFASVCLALIAAAIVAGQSRGPASLNNAKRIVSTETLREMTKADSDSAIPRPPSRSTNTAMVKQLKDDFRSLQQINNAMMGYVWGTNEVDDAKVSGMITDINKRASRLKKNLSLPEPGVKQDSQFRPNISNLEDLKQNLLMMDKGIADFVNSPLLRKPDVISPESAQQASAALDRVISMSAAIGKAWARLQK
jgi:hypothetical protein